jgi:phytol kinase
MNPDLLVLALVYVYLFGTLGVTEWLRRRRGFSVAVTRKVVHIAAGMCAVPLLLFQNRWIALIPPVSFIFINAVSYWQGTFVSMETGEERQLGTIYFPISFSVLTWLLWDHPALLVASLMPMTWGDALAAAVGQRWGQRPLGIPGNGRTVEGSLVFFVVAGVATAIPLALIAGTPFPGWRAVPVALVVAAVTAGVEALSPWGTDNLTVPAAATLVLLAAQALTG